MKKIIIAMLCCAFVASGFADTSASICGPVEKETSCQIWFNGKGSGKISCVAKTQTYKTVKTLKITSCQLVIGGSGSPAAAVVVKGTKKGVGSFEKTLVCSEFAWNVFGKNLNKVQSGNAKKTVTLEGEMYFRAADEEGTMEVSGRLTGKVRAKTTGGCTPCGDTTSVTYTPGTFKGRFHGWAVAPGCASELTCALEEGTCSETKCLTFVEPTEEQIEMFDGQITLKYDSKNSGYKAR